jgi:hypothetical protein
MEGEAQGTRLLPCSQDPESQQILLVRRFFVVALTWANIQFYWTLNK